MDFPTLVYLLALGAYSLFTWWKKNKAGKNAQKPAQGEAKPEVPEWMKEIFGEAFDEPTPKPTPRPIVEAAPAPSAKASTAKRPTDNSSRQIETETIAKYNAPAKVEKLEVEDTKPDLMALYAKRKATTYDMPGDVAASSIDADGVSAYEIGGKTTSNDAYEEIDWRKAIILAEVLQPYGERKTL